MNIIRKIVRWFKRKKTLIEGNVYGEIIYMNPHIDIITNACSECYNVGKERTYEEKQDYIKKRSLTGHESIFEHSNVVMLLSMTDRHVDDLVDLITVGRIFLSTRSIKIGKERFLLIGGSIRGYKEIFRNIKNMNNTLLSTIKENLYELESCYFVDFIKDGIMDERQFVNMNEFHKEMLFKNDKVDVENCDDLYKIISKLRGYKVYGDGKFTYNDILDMATITIHVKEISRIISQQLTRHRVGITQLSQRYVDYSKEKFLSPYLFKPDKYEEDDSYSIRIGGVDFIVSQECLGNMLMDIYPQLIEQGLLKEDARAYLPNNARTSLYMTFTIRQFLHFLQIRLEPAAQAEVRQLANILREWFESGSLGTSIIEDWFQYLEPVYKQLYNSGNEVYDEQIDEVISSEELYDSDEIDKLIGDDANE